MTARPDSGGVDARLSAAEAAGADVELLRNFGSKRPSLQERFEAGKALRAKVPREDHAVFEQLANRPDPVAILEQQNLARVQKLVPVRFARMLASPFTFLRGSAAVMASDLAGTPTTNLMVQACGDMHVANFGVFGSAERNLIFAINDFDETHPGCWEWDLKRLAASAAVAANFVGGDKHDAFDAARTIAQAYRRRMRDFSQMGFLEVWYSRIEESAILNTLSPRASRAAKRIMAKARQKGHIQMFDKLTEDVDGERRILEEPPLIVRETHNEDGAPIAGPVNALLKSYGASLSPDRRHLLSRYRLVDVARKVVGVGSVGTRCWIALLLGLDNDDPLFLQIKEAPPSVLAGYATSTLPHEHQGQRVVAGQRLIQGSPDIFLGWSDGPKSHFYVRQLADLKGSVKFQEGKRESLSSLTEYWALCGWALALAHAKSGDAATIAGYCGKSEVLDDAIAKFSLTYAKRTDRDYDLLDAARRTGRIRVASDEVVN